MNGYQLSDREQIFLSALGSTLAGFLVWWVQSRLSMAKYATGDLVNPEPVKDIADSLPAGEDAFINAAHHFVANNVKYEGYASDLYFMNDSIRCAKCYNPEVTLEAGGGNCVAMSSVLASILRNRLPAQRVMMAVGDMSVDGFGGHAWVEVERNGKWYVLESTALPHGMVAVDKASKYYQPKTLFNDEDFVCYDDDLCKVSVGDCACLKHMHIFD